MDLEDKTLGEEIILETHTPCNGCNCMMLKGDKAIKRGNEFYCVDYCLEGKKEY